MPDPLAELSQEKKTRPYSYYFLIFFLTLAGFSLLVLGAKYLLSLKDKDLDVTFYSSRVSAGQIIVSHSYSDSLYACHFELASAGTGEKFMAYFKPFSLRRCDVPLRNLRAKLDCIYENLLRRFLRQDEAVTLDKFLPDREMTIPLGQFYTIETSTPAAFLTQHTPADAYSLTTNCRLPDRSRATQTIIY